MKLHVTGCSHHHADITVREQLAFTPEQAAEALSALKAQYPQAEAVVLSTCNRTEIYMAAEDLEQVPSHHDVTRFLAEFHDLDGEEVFDVLFERTGEDAVRHLLMVAASLDSMVIGETQILSQVKQAFAMAKERRTVGPLMHLAFAAANRVAKRIQTETEIHRRRISIPSIAVNEFACRLFERFDDKQVLVIGAGEMAEETVRYLVDAGTKSIIVTNRHQERADHLSSKLGGVTAPWESLEQQLVDADLVISTTGATEPIVTSDQFRKIHRERSQKVLFLLDLAVPRDFDARIGTFNNVYLYCIDDLSVVCEKNRNARQKEWPRAEQIIDDELARFMADWHHHQTAPAIRELRATANEARDRELERLWNKLGEIDARQKEEIEQAFDRVINKLLHPPLESIRSEAENSSPQGLIKALKRLFQIGD